MVNRTDEEASLSGLEQRAKAAFDDSVDDLDGRTRSALTQARHAALAEIDGSKRSGVWRILGPMGGVVAAALVIAVMFGPVWTTTQQVTADNGSVAFEDLDIVADAENLEMLENLDFYAWLDSPDALPSG